MKKNKTNSTFSCSDLQGNLFLPDQLQQIFSFKGKRQTPDDYEISPGLTIKEVYSTAWRVASASWEKFSQVRTRQNLSEENLQTATEDFAKFFFHDVLQYQWQRVSFLKIEDTEYPVCFLADTLPVLISSPDTSLDSVGSCFGASGEFKNKAPFQVLQSFLNSSAEYRWGMVFNGVSVRLVRDSMSLTRPSYLEFNLQEMFSGEHFSEFIPMWAFLHHSRTKLKDGKFVWDDWIQEGADDGQRARQFISFNVKNALLVLGNGFLQTKGNDELIKALKNGSLTSNEYLKELLRLMYRFLFIFCLEERELLHTREETPKNLLARERYREGYALHRFKDECLKKRFYTDYKDAWESVKIVFKGLAKGQSQLSLPALGGLFTEDQCPHLDRCELRNSDFYEAMKLIRWSSYFGSLTAINYKNMGTEELGSIYESLLELIPILNLDVPKMTFLGQSNAENERKNTGSYYTPDCLVHEIIKSALDPVIERTLRENPGNPEKALLALRIIDPSCGSGHFLLAAARRIAENLASVRSLYGVVLPESYRAALREVIHHCIYGVDINPQAIELARMALWLEGYEEGCPLSFLDHHLKVGNSLVGIFDTSYFKYGISPLAYKAQAGDSKDVCMYLASENTKARKALEAQKKEDDRNGSLKLFDINREIQKLREIEELPCNTLEEVERQKKLYHEAYANLIQEDIDKANTIIAAFLAPKTEETQFLVPTSETLNRQMFFPQGLTDEDKNKIRFAQKICKKSKVFHWFVEFGHIFSDGGFDCVLGNPPWEKAKVEDVKWFHSRYLQIAEASTAAKRKKLIELLKEGRLASTTSESVPFGTISEAEKELYLTYEADCQLAAAASVYCHLNKNEGGRYPLCGRGDTNLYAYFAELSLQLIKQKGIAGIIAPPGLVTDDATKAFSGKVFNGHLKSMYQFDNREKLFPIDSRYSFALFTFAESEKTDCVFYASHVEHLQDARRHISFRKGDLALFNPNTQTCLLFRSNKDLEICRKLYEKAPILFKEGDKNGNPWQIKTMSMFHMTNDSHLFYTREDKTNDLVPLYEGKLIHQFDNRWATYEEVIKDKPKERDVTQAEKEDPSFEITPRFWVDRKEVLAKFTVKPKKSDKDEYWWNEPWMLTFRGISRSTDQRTLISTVIPSIYGVGNSAPLLFSTKPPASVACLLALLNSIVVDYVMRIKQSGANVNIFIFNQLPIISPEQLSLEDLDFIVPRIAKLTRTNKVINDIWLTDYPEYQFQPRRERLQIRAELDAYIARMYGLTRKDLQYILDPSSTEGDDFPSVTFPGLKRDEIAEFGEYLTERLVLETFDKLENGTLQ
jgi:hypothetical protein